MRREQEVIQAELMELANEAEREHLWVHCNVDDLWFSPVEFRSRIRMGQFVWGRKNFELRGPAEHLAELIERERVAHEAVTYFVSRMLLIACLAFLLPGCDFRCHTRHLEVSYHSAYTTWGQNCTTTGFGRRQSRSCVSYPISHPATCHVSDVCDVRCKTLDEGKAEAHPNHEPHRTPLNLDPQFCTDGGNVR